MGSVIDEAIAGLDVEAFKAIFTPSAENGYLREALTHRGLAGFLEDWHPPGGLGREELVAWCGKKAKCLAAIYKIVGNDSTFYPLIARALRFDGMDGEGAKLEAAAAWMESGLAGDAKSLAKACKDPLSSKNANMVLFWCHRLPKFLESDGDNAISFLKKAWDSGLLKAAGGYIGPATLMCAGMPRCARFLMELGVDMEAGARSVYTQAQRGSYRCFWSGCSASYAIIEAMGGKSAGEVDYGALASMLGKIADAGGRFEPAKGCGGPLCVAAESYPEDEGADAPLRDLLRQCVGHGADPSSERDFFKLMMSRETRDVDWVAELKALGFDFEKRSDWVCEETIGLEMAKRFEAAGAIYESCSEGSKLKAGLAAVGYGSPGLLEFMVEAGLGRCSVEGLHALALKAVVEDESECLGILLGLPVGERLAKHEAAAKTAPSATLMHAAASAGLAKMCEAIGAAGGEPNARNAKGETPMHKALVFGHPKEGRESALGVVAELLRQGGDAGALDAQGRTPLQRGCHGAPLSVLAVLARMRPADVAGVGTAAANARKSLSKRGGGGKAILDLAELSASGVAKPGKRSASHSL